MLLFQILRTNLYIVPLLGQESMEMCIAAWATVLLGGLLEYLMIQWEKKWVLPAVAVTLMVLAEVAFWGIIYGGANAWLAFGIMPLEVFILYFITGLLLGWAVHVWKQHKQNKTTTE